MKTTRYDHGDYNMLFHNTSTNALQRHDTDQKTPFISVTQNGFSFVLSFFHSFWTFMY